MKSLLVRWLPALLALVGAVLFYAFGRLGFEDFAVFYKAGARWVAGEQLYRDADGHFSFKYFPPSALLFAPFGLLSYKAACAIWFGLMLGGLLALLRYAGRAVMASGPKVGGLLLVLTFFILLKSTGQEVMLGQVNLLMGLCVVLALVAQQKGHWQAQGLWLVLAVMLKPSAIILWPYWLLRRQWRALGLSLGVFAGVFLLSAMQYPMAEWHGLFDGFEHIVGDSNAALTGSASNASMLGAMTQWFGGRLTIKGILLLNYAALGLIAAAYLPGFIRRRYDASAMLLETAGVLVFCTLASPQGWFYSYCGAAVAIVALLGYRRSFPKVLWASAVICFLLIGAILYDIVTPIFGKPFYVAFEHSGLLAVAFGVVVLLLAWLNYNLPRPTTAAC